tara:strand:- start:184 stop:384 length:201 start_codon:yes stop_codon:yes gene_type:complete
MNLKKNPKDFGDKFNNKNLIAFRCHNFFFLDEILKVVVNKFFVGIRVKYTHFVSDPVEKETSISTR